MKIQFTECIILLTEDILMTEVIDDNLVYGS